MSDRTVYIGALVVGFFAIMLCVMPTEVSYWPYFTLAYIAFLLYTINLAGWRIYQAKHIAGWRQSLAKLPLITVGYGSKSGKAVEAAHGQPAVRKAMITSTLVSLALLALLAVVLLRLV